MLLIHGAYHFGRRKIGVRKDFCGACEREGVSELWRSFDWLHLFWIPWLPLGRHERWICTLCNQDPRKRTRTRKGFKIAGLFVLAVMLVSMFTVEVDPKEAVTLWVGRIAVAVGFLGLLYSVLKKPPVVSEDERRHRVTPLSAVSCFYCRGPLVAEPNLHCPTCQIRVYTDERAVPPSEYRAIIHRLAGAGGELFRAASESDLAKLRALRLPESVVAFYRHCEPASVVENGQTIRLWPIADLLEDNIRSSVGGYASPHGYIEFASTFSGDAYCFDTHSLDASGAPRIVLISHELVSDEITAEELGKIAKPVASNLREFLEKFADGDLDEETSDYAE
jgi:hypothetical protein